MIERFLHDAGCIAWLSVVLMLCGAAPFQDHPAVEEVTEPPAEHSGSTDDGPSVRPVDDDEIISQLRTLSDRHTDVDDLEAKFSQVRETAALRRAVTSTGTVQVRGDASHWTTTEPYTYHMWVRGSTVSFYYPDDAVAEIYDLSDVADHLSFSPDLDLPQLQKRFIISRSSIRLAETNHLGVRLTPRSAAADAVLLPMDVTIDLNSGHVHSVLTVDADGNRTTMTFSDVRTNGGLTADDVTPTWPDDVAVQRIDVVDAPAASDDAQTTDKPDDAPPADAP